MKYPSTNTFLNIQVFDNDILSHDDFICGTDLDLTMMIEDIYNLNIPLKFDKTYFEDFVKFHPDLKNKIHFDYGNEEKAKFWIKCFRTEGVKSYLFRLIENK